MNQPRVFSVILLLLLLLLTKRLTWRLVQKLPGQGHFSTRVYQLPIFSKFYSCEAYGMSTKRDVAILNGKLSTDENN